MLDLQSGDECEIKLCRKQIKLIPAGTAEEDEAAAAALTIIATSCMAWPFSCLVEAMRQRPRR